MNELTKQRSIALYEIAAEVQAVLCEVGDDGEMPADLDERLDELGMAFSDKANAIVAFRQNLVATELALANEIGRLMIWKNSIARRADWLRDYLKTNMDMVGLKHLETRYARLSICKNSQPSVILDGSDIPIDYQHVRVELDRAAVLEAHRAGVKLPDCLRVEQGTHLRIK